MHAPIRTILTPLLALAAVGSLTATEAAAPKAEAAAWGFSIKHGPDAGYDEPIIVNCAGVSGRQYVHEGQHSDDVCSRAGGDEHVLGFYVGYNEKMSCLVGTDVRTWRVMGTTEGWHGGGNRLAGWNPCVMGLDSIQ